MESDMQKVNKKEPLCVPRKGRRTTPSTPTLLLLKTSQKVIFRGTYVILVGEAISGSSKAKKLQQRVTAAGSVITASVFIQSNDVRVHCGDESLKTFGKLIMEFLYCSWQQKYWLLQQKSCL
jgi:hypothetical protein